MNIRSVVASTAFAVCALVLPSQAAKTCTWTGGGADNNWSTPENWGGSDASVVPATGDAVVLTNVAPCGIVNNDIEGLTLASVTYTGAASYALTGKKLLLTSAIYMRGTGGVQTNDVEIGLTGGFDISFYGASQNVFTKKISPTDAGSTKNIYIRNPNNWHTGTLTFDGDIDARWMTVRTYNHRKTGAGITFNGKVNCYNLWGDDGSSGNCWGPVWLNNNVACETIRVGTSRYNVGDDCTFDARNELAFTVYSEASEDYRGWFDLQGCDLSVKNLYGDRYRTSTLQSTRPATLTVKATKDASFYTRIQGKVSLDYAPTDAYTLDLTSDESTRASTMAGTITVSAGTLKISRNRTLKNVPSVTVAENATLSIDAAANPFSDALVLRVAESGKVVLPDSFAMTVDNLFVGLTKKPAGTYTGDPGAENYLPQLEGKCTLTVTGADEACVWTGGAGDGLWSSADNWENGDRPQAGDSVSLSGAGLVAVGGVMTADIAGLELGSIEVTGSSPFRLDGAVTVVLAEPLVLSQTCTFTNAAALTFASAASTVSMKDSAARFVNLGALSGASEKLVYTGVSGSSCSVGGAPTYTGDTAFEGSLRNVAVLSPTAFGGGRKVSVGGGTLALRAGGTYEQSFVFGTGNSTCYLQFECPEATTYVMNGDIDGTRCSTLRAMCPNGLNVGSTVTFNGTIDCTGKTLEVQFYSTMTINYNGVVKAAAVTGSGGVNNGTAWQRLYATAGDFAVGEWRPCYSSSLMAERDNVFGTTPGAVPRFLFDGYSEAGNGPATGLVDLHGHEMTADRVDSAAGKTATGRVRSSGGHGRLVLRGSADALTYALFEKDLDVVWDPTGDFTQTFKDRASTMTGSLVVKGGTMLIDGTASFLNVTNVTVASGAKFTSANAASLNTAAVTLDVSSGAELRLPAGAYAFAAVRRDGEPLTGDITPAELPELKSAGVTLLTPIEIVEATWRSDGAAGDSLATAANWMGDVTPNLANGAVVAVFAAEGAHAEVPAGGVYLNALKFENAETEFAVEGTGTLSLRDGGIHVAESHQGTVSAPLAFRYEQLWNVQKGGVLTVGDMPGANGFTVRKTGVGTLALRGEAGDIGAFTGEAGTVEVWAPTNAFGTASSTIPVSIYENAGEGAGTVKFCASTVVERPFDFHYSSQTARQGVYAMTGAQVRFTEYVRFRPGGYCDGSMRILDDAALIFEKGVRTGFLDIYGCGNQAHPSRFVVNGGTWDMVDKFYLHDCTRVELNAPQLGIERPFYFRGKTMTGHSDSSIAFGADYALDSAKAGFDVSAEWKGVIALNGHDQRIGVLTVPAGCTGCITSDAPAQLHFVCSTAGTVSTPFFRGLAGLEKSGAETLTLAARMPSNGSLSVEEGTLAFASGACWGRKAALSIATGATLDLAAGVELRTSTLIVGGVACADGYWGSTTCTDSRVPVDHRISAITGDGVVANGQFGMSIIIH